MHKKLSQLTLLASTLFFTLGSHADSVVAYWDFGSEPFSYNENATINHTVGSPNVVVLGDAYDVDGQDGTSFVDAEESPHSAGQALAWGSGVNEGTQEWVMSIDLTGYENLAIRWDYRSTGTGPTNATLDYKVGTGEWSVLDLLSMTDDSAFHEYQKNMTALSGINNQSDVQFRLSEFTGGTGSGTHRIDNLQIFTVPEPAALGLTSLAVISLLVSKRIFSM